MKLSDETIAKHRLTDSFVPPFPKWHERPISVWKAFRLMRRNLLSVFNARDYRNSAVSVRSRFMARNIYLTNRADLVRRTLHEQADTFRPKTPQQVRCLKPILGDGLFVSDGELWAERRAAVAPIVHGRQIAKFAPIMAETVREWGVGWRSACAQAGGSASIDVVFEMGELTAEIIARTVFGRTLGREHTHEIIAGFADYQRYADRLALGSLIGLPEHIHLPQGPRARHAKRRVHQAIDHLIDTFDASADADAVIAGLFDARDSKGERLSRAATRNEAIVLFMAGHETTANTMTWALYCTAMSPRVRLTLEKELGEVLRGRPPTLADVPKLIYTRAIIEETLRLYPPVPFIGRTASQPGKFDERTVPKGSLLLVCAWLLHRNKDVWSLPQHFVPERFLRSVSKRPDKYGYIPFATGERVCPGRIFALTETVLCLATLWQAFDIRPATGLVVETDCKITLRPTAPLTMTLHPRKGAVDRLDEAEAPVPAQA